MGDNATMNATDDAELLRRYAEEKSEAAFAELVRRHVNLVYAGALRRVGGDAQLAEDVTQLVFTALARGAGTLARHPVLSGWLFTTTRNAAAQVVRTERRRQAREQEAHTMNELSAFDSPSANVADWERLRPVIDEAMDRLSDDDRQAVLLRFFEGKSFSDVGAKLRLTENTARMRVERALDKLHALLARRGVTSTTAALAVALANQAVVAAPAGLAAAVTGAALAGAGVAAGAGQILSIMSITKLNLGLIGAVAVAGATTAVVQQRTNAGLRGEVAALQTQAGTVASLRNENERLAAATAKLEQLRRDDAELIRLQAEESSLRSRALDTAKAQLAAAQTVANEAMRREAAAVFEVTKLDRQPRVTVQARPVYPAELRAAGVAGEVVVDFIVSSDGEAKNAFAVKSSQREFEAAAVAAVSQWKFAPGQKGGRLVNTRMQVPIVFSPAKGEGEPGGIVVKSDAAKP